jgi:hypothetical protein
MPVEEAPNDDEARQSYNFCPGYHGLVYRADGPEHGGQHDDKEEETIEANKEGATGETKYKLQAMQWGMLCEGRLILHTDMTQGLCHFSRSVIQTMPVR